MAQYKLTNDYYTGESSIIIFGGLNIPRDPTNTDYLQFIKDVAEQGYDIVEGPDAVQPSYADLRRADYPPIEDQLDKIYHSGVNAWKAQIKEIKERHPKAITQDVQTLLLFLIGYTLLLIIIDIINNLKHMLLHMKDSNRFVFFSVKKNCF